MTPTLAAIARPSGALAMVAMDQRESLRTMFAEAGRGQVAEAELIEFKVAVARTLGPYASGFLADREYGLSLVRHALPESTGLILAADALQQRPEGPVEETDLDGLVLAPDFDLQGVVALKLLVIWRRDGRRPDRVEMARRFVTAAAERGLLSVLEPVVRATQAEIDAGTWDMDAAIIEAAGELSPLGPSLCKVQVPRGGRGPEIDLREACRRLGEAIIGPWVVLSQGVAHDDFPRGVEAACAAGASGFLAGRALWSDVVGRADLDVALHEVSLPRLGRLIDLVDAHARPWEAAA